MHVKYWDKIKKVHLSALTGDGRYPNNPTSTGYLDNMDDNMLERRVHYALQMWSYFKAPATGFYTFRVAPGGLSIVKFGEDQKSAKKIIELKGKTPRLVFDK